MKFNQKELLDALKAKLTANGKHLAISEKTLKAIADTQYSLSVNEETELGTFVDSVLPMFESLRGNYEKDNADFIAQWKKEHPEPNPTKPQTPPSGDDDKLDALMKEIQALKEANESSKREKTISEKKESLIATMKEKGIKDQKWLKSYLANTSITEDMDVEEKANSALEFFNLSHSTTDDDFQVMTPGTPPANNQGQFDDVVSIMKRQRPADA